MDVGALPINLVKGVGSSAARKLSSAGIESVGALSRLDLRRDQIEGLSTPHLRSLRANAQRLIQAMEDPSDLTLVPGMGPSAQGKIRAMGVKTIEELAGLDLRRTRVSGLSNGHLQKLKREARYLVA